MRNFRRDVVIIFGAAIMRGSKTPDSILSLELMKERNRLDLRKVEEMIELNEHAETIAFNVDRIADLIGDYVHPNIEHVIETDDGEEEPAS